MLGVFDPGIVQHDPFQIPVKRQLASAVAKHYLIPRPAWIETRLKLSDSAKPPFFLR